MLFRLRNQHCRVFISVFSVVRIMCCVSSGPLHCWLAIGMSLAKMVAILSKIVFTLSISSSSNFAYILSDILLHGLGDVDLIVLN